MKKTHRERLQAAKRVLFRRRIGWFPFQGMTKSGRVRRKGLDNEAWSLSHVCHVWQPSQVTHHVHNLSVTSAQNLYQLHVLIICLGSSKSFYQKCRWQVTTCIHPWTNEVGVGWLCHCRGLVWEPIWKWAHMQLVKENSAMVVSAHWATVDWSRHKEWKWRAWANLHFKREKKMQAGNKWSNILQKSLQASKKPPPPSPPKQVWV